MKPTVTFFVVLLLAGCSKKYDNPPYQVANEGARISIAQLKSRLAGQTFIRFVAGDTNLYCTVTADETSGNLYREVYVRDDEGQAIKLNLLDQGGLFEGDQVRVNLNGLYLVSANSLVYLDSVSVEKNVVKLSSGHPVQPIVVSLESVVAQPDPLDQHNLQSRLVEINHVEFALDERGKTFGDVIGKSATDRVLTDCEGHEVVVRTSGFANFAGKTIPGGNGRLVAIVSQYKNTIQLIVRRHADVAFVDPPCFKIPVGKVYHQKNFNDNDLSSGGWSSWVVVNDAVKWTISSSTGLTPFGKITGFSAGVNTNSENWYISPLLGIADATNVALSFQTAAKFSGSPLEVLVSTTYTGGVPKMSDWVLVPPTYTLSPPSGNYFWTSSGNISLNEHKNETTRIAFRYRSTTAGATTYELDDITVHEN